MGARGNSGVILSQIIAGFAAPDVGTALDGVALAAALERGRAAAYHVVSAPKEGTILTAITAAAQSARARAALSGGGGVGDVLAAAVDGAREAVARTPELLPVLKAAGVVDAGAQGLAIVLEGMMRGLLGDQRAVVGDFGHIDASWMAATRRVHGDGERSGFCTEFVVQGESLDADAIRQHLASAGESLLVVGGGDLVRVHVHTSTPDDALAYARTLGSVTHEKVEDMEAQFEALAERESHVAVATDVASDGVAVARGSVAVIAVGAGDGIEALLRSLGAAAVVRGGQTMNPSAGEIRDAIVATRVATPSGAGRVIVLPNNKNIVLAAQQAAKAVADGGAGIDVRVLRSTSVPEGVAALIAMNSEASFDENVAAMEQSIAAVRSGEVTLAARATTLDGVEVREGQPIALVGDVLIAATETIAEAVQACVARMIGEREAPLVTLYAGEGETTDGAEAIAAGLRDEFGAEVEVVAGGQPHYAYLIGVE